MAGLFDGIIIGFLTLTFGIFAASALIGDWGDNYDGIADLDNVSDDFTNSFNAIDNITDLSRDIEGNVIDNPLDEEDSDTGSISSMSRGAYSAIRLIPRTFDIFNAIASDIGKVVGFQCNNTKYDSKGCWVIDIFLYMFIITIIFGIIYFARGFKTRG